MAAVHGGQHPVAPPLYPSPQYRTESPRRSWMTTGTPAMAQQPRWTIDDDRRPRSTSGAAVVQQERDPAHTSRYMRYTHPNLEQPHADRTHSTGQKPSQVSDSGYGGSIFSDPISFNRSRVPPADYQEARTQSTPYPITQHDRRPSRQTERESLAETLLDSDYGYQEANDPKYHWKGKEATYYRDDDEETLVPPQLYPPAPSELVPVMAHPRPAPDYLGQRPPTPSSSNPSIRTYISRFKRFVDKVRELPWMDPERVTVDYYPGTGKHSARHLKHRPLLVWRNPQYYPSGYHSESDTASQRTSSSSYVDATALPQTGNRASLDLRDEFDDVHPPRRSVAADPAREPDGARTAVAWNWDAQSSAPSVPTAPPATAQWSTLRHSGPQPVVVVMGDGGVPVIYQPQRYSVPPMAVSEATTARTEGGGGYRFPNGYVPYHEQHTEK
ncbi:hypothetical protein CC2G_015182 [Coprinopsis cinerea AmutBmut pab1-1]|nr:hypothetical protein CC2G_015182 [Coprinopsis cinerea AmutBmut pab1-1]